MDIRIALAAILWFFDLSCIADNEGMVDIPGGKMTMGTNSADGRDGESPTKEVTVGSFRIDKYPVTNLEFREFVRAQKYKTEAETFGWSFVFHDFVSEDLKSKVTEKIESAPWWLPVERVFWRQPAGPGSGIRERLEYPVVQVSWNDAQAFCSWRGRRLPSEEEWEWAARGGLQGRTYPWGNKFQVNRSNLWQGLFPDGDNAEDGYHGIAPVTAFPPQNNYGLYDMMGNAWEWTSTPFPGARPMFVLRGASWIDTVDGSANHKARITTRMSNTPDSASDNLGFRCAFSQGEKQRKKKKAQTELQSHVNSPAMGDYVPFSILNERLRPRFTAMERLCFPQETLEEGSKRPGMVVTATSTDDYTIQGDEPQTRVNSTVNLTEPEDEPEQGNVMTKGLSHMIKEGGEGQESFTLVMSGDRFIPLLTIEDAVVDDGELTAVSESASVENDGQKGLSTVSEGEGSEAVSADSSFSRWRRVEGTLPDVIRGGRPLNRRRTLGPVSDTLNEVRREVELSRRRSLRLKAQVDKLQDNRVGSEWSQQIERVTQDVQGILKLLLPLAEEDSSLVQPSGQEISLDTSLVLLKNVARKLALNHTAKESGVRIENDVVDSAVLQQALCDRDDAFEKKKAMEAELLRSKTDMMLLNNQLLEAVQKRLEIAVELETWKDDVQMILKHQLHSQQMQAAEEVQRKPSLLGLLKKSNRSPTQKPASTPCPAPSTFTPGKVLPTSSTPVPSPQHSPVTWKDRLKRRKGTKVDRHSDQNAVQASLSSADTGPDDGFQNIDL
ncbi:hypothetical protein DPEC_G00236240 [Dallia pectoralis]|uniref:Uncharacterized protein n=1 Tax=Dallia pectoralis TaxID=75939 RepID=A0ACC2FYC4_DALPE|nr:hypothetical protein DPEC_G00236240 [Dallia pectoralis]